ncbi:serine protease [Methylophaga sp. 42_25_T18]|nr:serine protease [Methylophaga sp. 42_25_T18]OUR88102.1 serine protease [Methylophaga sp. 42_8_T64]
MKLLSIFTLIFWVFTSSVLADDTQGKQAFVLELDGVISPATADYFERSLEKADQANTELILVKMDTPGGLDLSMRKIIKQIIAAPVPIITYVTPSGSRAASAGTYILYASHIAAMAPATNLGAATPVQIVPSIGPKPGKDNPLAEEETENESEPVDLDHADAMTKKIVNDAVAYIRGLAKLRGRNEEWAEQAVLEGVSLTAEDALEINVIDIIAVSQSDLFEQINGRTVSVLGNDRTINTSGLVLTEIKPDWRNKLLAVITNPNIAYILMLIGIYGLIFEFSNPGAILPGTVGSICLLLALFSFQVLPINYAGLALIILGIALMTAEAFQPSFGILGLGGMVAFVAGSVILIDTDIPGYGINLGIIAGFAVTTAAFFILALGLVVKARRKPVVSGQEQMIGAACVAMDDFDHQGRVFVHSEVWKARTDIPMKKGDKAKVKTIRGLVLDVIPDIK